MQLMNNDLRYGLVAKGFHWVMFLMIAFLLLMHQLGHIFPRGTEERFVLVWLHQSIGITVFFLVVLRLIWRLFNPRVPYPATMPVWQRNLSSAVHWLLYTVILLQPIAGMLMVRARGRDAMFFNARIPGFAESNEQLVELASFLHRNLFEKVLFVFIAFHILAALYHHFIVKDNILRRMGWGA